MTQGRRRLVAIMFTDVVGYTAIGQRDESLSLAILGEYRKLLRPIFTRHHGKEVKTIGDAFLLTFPNSLDAVRCAYDVQRAVREFNITLPNEKRVKLRVGIHLGDVLETPGDILGDAVNVASRIEQLAEDGGICLTQQVFDQVRNKFELSLESMGKQTLKNVDVPVETYRMVLPWEKERGRQQSALDRHRIAILPLTNISADPNDDYFADGLTEEMISAISTIPNLTVIARTSVMRYKGLTKSVEEIGQELKVGTILEGSVRKSANKLRITAQLIDVQSQGHLWSENYDRLLEDVFAVQSEVAQKIAESLRLKLLQAEKDRLSREATDSISAYTLYLKGRYYWNERTETGVRKGIEYLQKAIQEDHDFALAYSDMADCYVVLADYSMMATNEALVKAAEYAMQALKLDATISQAHASLAAVHERNLRWTDAEREFKRAIELNPSNATAHHWYALDLLFSGKTEQALQEWRNAMKLDPFSLIVRSAFGVALARSGKGREGIDMVKSAIEMNPSFPVAHRNLAHIYLMNGMPAEAVEEVQKLETLESGLGFKVHAASVYASAGRREEARKILDVVLKEATTRYVDPANVGMIYAALDDETHAIEWLERAIETRSAGLPYAAVLPAYDSLRESRRFKELMSQIGLG